MDGADFDHMTLSRDAFSSQPKFNEKGKCTGLTYATPKYLHKVICALVRRDTEAGLNSFCVFLQHSVSLFFIMVKFNKISQYCTQLHSNQSAIQGQTLHFSHTSPVYNAHPSCLFVESLKNF